jgi:hypothetical protein
MNASISPMPLSEKAISDPGEVDIGYNPRCRAITP